MARAGDGNRESTGRWSLRVRVWLVALAIVPLFGAGWFAFTDMSRVAETRRQSEAVAAATGELTRVTELRARLFDERNWASADIGLRELGFDPEFVAALVGIDISAQLEAAVTEVDRLTAELDWPEIEMQIADHRAQESDVLDDLGFDYAGAIGLAEQRSDIALDALLDVAGDLSGGAALVDAVRVLDAAVTARQAVTIQLTSYFGAQFAGGEIALLERQRLSEEQTRYLDAIADIERIAAPSSKASQATRALDEAEDVVTFRAAMEELLARPPRAPGDSFNVLGVLSEVQTIATAFRAAAGSVEDHLVLLDAAEADIAAVGVAVDAAAAGATRQSLLRIIALGGASLVFALGLAHAIGRPLRDLAHGAQDLRDGNAGAMRASGPREVREAIEALNEAAGHIELANRQARALAGGHLDSPVLAETTSGALGESLQEAVQTLASSLNHREALAQQLTHEATHDSLTRLANRSASLAHLQEGLEAVRGTERLLSVSFIDLDGFKLINDHHGHSAGDEVLAIVGRRLIRALGSDHNIGRLGGDEFVVVSTTYESVADVRVDAERVIEMLSQPIQLESRTVRVSASVGIAVAETNRVIGAHELLSNADLAVYKAKERGRGSIEICDDDLRAELAERTEVEEALRIAVERDHFELHFQPIVAAGTRTVTSLEALVRWRRPGRGLVAPVEFIPIAERSDLILEIDKVVMQKAARQLRDWSDHPQLCDVAVAINVSAGHLLSRSFVDDMLRPLHEFGVDPSRVVMEVTESALLQDLDLAAAKLAELRHAGMRVAIDDFGTGYTSLSQLRRLPVDILKIDRTFVADESATALVELIIDMGHVLGARVIAEGIETRSQAVHLASLGADGLQGFLFGRPLPPADIERQSSGRARGVAIVRRQAAAG